MKIHRYAPYIIIILGLGIGVYLYYRTVRDKSKNNKKDKGIRPLTDGSRAPRRGSTDSDRPLTKVNNQLRCIPGKNFRLDDRHICLWGFKNDIPVTNQEIKNSGYNYGSITFNEHPVRLMVSPSDKEILQDVHINRLWWQLPGVKSIISGYEPNEYFILNDKGLWYSKTNFLSLLSSNVPFDKLFKYKGIPYGLKDGKIRKGLSKIEYQRNNKIYEESVYWNWEEVSFISGVDLEGIYIKDIKVSRNNDILLIDHRNSIRLLGKSYDYSKIRIDGIHDIKLGHDYKHILVFHNGSVSLVENNTVIFTIPDVSDAIIDPVDKYSIYTLQNGILSVHTYPRDNLNENGDRVLIYKDFPNKRLIPGIYSKLLDIQDRHEIFGITDKNYMIRL